MCPVLYFVKQEFETDSLVLDKYLNVLNTCCMNKLQLNLDRRKWVLVENIHVLEASDNNDRSGRRMFLYLASHFWKLWLRVSFHFHLICRLSSLLDFSNLAVPI